MKETLTYSLAIVAIAVSGFLGWNAKEKYEAKVKDRIELQGQNKNLTASISKEETNRDTATEAKDLALDEASKAKAELEAAKGSGAEKAKTLESVSSNLEVAAAEKKKIDASMEALRGKFPGIELGEVPRVVKELEASQKKLVGEEEDASLVKKRLEEDIAKNLAESSRIAEKNLQSIKRVEGNTFQATIVAVDNDWNFVVIGAGEKSGLTGSSKLLIQRDGRLLGKLLISKLEPNTAVADVEPGSLRNGVALQAGDQVILESVSAN
ncbi:MAG: hypothetical protein P8I39_04065 [Akkermansiaceae bacterium]|jgi:hypothetical protein|nr:hypothetical protein [Akkermansiaceae bacterium]|tara:strand:- start:308 stop:1108 length:801 start_codon:yes stop_codon:yes gene_type:complete